MATSSPHDDMPHLVPSDSEDEEEDENGMDEFGGEGSQKENTPDPNTNYRHASSVSEIGEGRIRIERCDIKKEKHERNQDIYKKYEMKIKKERYGKQLPAHPKFGHPNPLRIDQIPTYYDIVRAILDDQSKIRLKQNMKQNPPKKMILERIAESLTTIANQISTKSKTSMKIKRVVELKLEISKSYAIIEYWRKKKTLSKQMENSLNCQIKLFCNDDISVTVGEKEHSADVSVTVCDETDDVCVTEKQKEQEELLEDDVCVTEKQKEQEEL